MLFAAGFGTRMAHLTVDRPKPLIEVAGKPLIDHALDIVQGFGPDRIVANLHYKPEALEQHLQGTGILLSHEQPDILETGGGLRAALPLLGAGPIFTMNTDAIWAGPNPLTLLAEHWNPARMDALLLCIPQDNALGHSGTGDFEIAEGGHASRGPGLIYSGAQIIKPDLLHKIDEDSFSLNLLWDMMLKQDRLFATAYPGTWCDVGRPEGIATAEAMLEQSDV